VGFCPFLLFPPEVPFLFFPFFLLPLDTAQPGRARPERSPWFFFLSVHLFFSFFFSPDCESVLEVDMMGGGGGGGGGGGETAALPRPSLLPEVFPFFLSIGNVFSKGVVGGAK